MVHVHCELLGLWSQEAGSQSSARDPARGKEMAKHQSALTSLEVEWLALTSGREGKLVLMHDAAGYHRLSGREVGLECWALKNEQELSL